MTDFKDSGIIVTNLRVTRNEKREDDPCGVNITLEGANIFGSPFRIDPITIYGLDWPVGTRVILDLGTQAYFDSVNEGESRANFVLRVGPKELEA